MLLVQEEGLELLVRVDFSSDSVIRHACSRPSNPSAANCSIQRDSCYEIAIEKSGANQR